MAVYHTQTTPPTEDQLAADWPDWKIWRGDTGWWCATRRRTLTGMEMQAGLHHTLIEDDAPTLVRCLNGQAEVEASLEAAR